MDSRPNYGKGGRETATAKGIAGCLAFIAAVVVIVVLVNISREHNVSSIKDISATVSFSGTAFKINNNDYFDWEDVKITINSVYVAHAPIIKAHEEVVIGAMYFSMPDGERFNPFTMKPMKTQISAKVTGGVGLYVGTWKR